MEGEAIGAPFEGELETRYAPDKEFIATLQAMPWSRKSLVSIKGKMRWIVTGDDGTRYIYRPDSGRPETEPQ